MLTRFAGLIVLPGAGVIAKRPLESGSTVTIRVDVGFRVSRLSSVEILVYKAEPFRVAIEICFFGESIMRPAPSEVYNTLESA